MTPELKRGVEPPIIKYMALELLKKLRSLNWLSLQPKPAPGAYRLDTCYACDRSVPFDTPDWTRVPPNYDPAVFCPECWARYHGKA